MKHDRKDLEVSEADKQLSESSLLSKEEIEELRERVRKQLAEEERKAEEARVRVSKVRDERAQWIREIEQDEEEKFYLERGYRRFVDRAGNTKWLSPEQYARWEEERSRQQRRKRDPRYHMSSRRARKVIVFVVAGVALILLLIFLTMLRRG